MKSEKNSEIISGFLNDAIFGKLKKIFSVLFGLVVRVAVLIK